VIESSPVADLRAPPARSQGVDGAQTAQLRDRLGPDAVRGERFELAADAVAADRSARASLMAEPATADSAGIMSLITRLAQAISRASGGVRTFTVRRETE
jgi:hypothetical protein